MSTRPKCTFTLSEPEQEQDRKQWEADVVRSARANHIWLNAMACVRPSEEFCAQVGRMVLDQLAQRESLIPSEHRLVGTERELILRINKS